MALEIDGAALADGCALLVEAKTILDFDTAQQLVHRLATLRYTPAAPIAYDVPCTCR